MATLTADRKPGKVSGKFGSALHGNDTTNRELIRSTKSSKRRQSAASSDSESEDDEDIAEPMDETEDVYRYPRAEDLEDKDEAELELERMLFGDSKSFRENIKSFGQKTKLGYAEEGATGLGDEPEGDDHLAIVQDSDLFFMDTAGSAGLTAENDLAQAQDPGFDDAPGLSFGKAAWEDSDDERISVSLASVPRLRKLRVTEDEDLITGKEYARRLRRQYTLLTPTPDWVLDAQQPPTKRRRLSDPEEVSDSEGSASDEDMSDEEVSAKPLSDILRSAASLTKSASGGKNRKLRAETLDIQRLRDIGTVQPSAVTSVSFHPTLPLLLTSGPSGTLFLHHIVPSPPAEEANPLLTSLHIRNTPLSTTAFHPTDARIFLSARRRYFHVWSLDTGKVEKITRIYGQATEQRSMETLKPSPCGRYVALKGTGKKGGGVINVLSASTLQWTAQLRIESAQGVADFCWWGDGRGMLIAGKNGEMTEWDVGRERVVGRWTDQGAVGTTVVALAGDAGVSGRAAVLGRDRWVAVGSSAGIANVYDRREWYHAARKEGRGDEVAPRNPVPGRVVRNLTTPISHLVFSPDAQVLCVSSRWKRDALRLVHLPSCTVFKNWPTSATPLGRVTGVAFGRAAEQTGGEGAAGMSMVVGNESGKLRMWEIRY